MTEFPRTGALSSRRDDWAWQWFNWPIFRHQYTTRSIWKPGFAPFREIAWQPDISGWTTGRFQYDMLNWSEARGRSPSEVLISMNTGTAWTLQAVTPPVQVPELIITNQLFTSNGTYTPPAGLQYAIVECVGGGGSGGSTFGNATSGAAGGGGGSGGYSRGTLSAAQIGAAQAVAVGQGGPSGGGNGQPSSFGALVVANGGIAGSNNDGTSIFGGGGPGAAIGTGTLTTPGAAGLTGISTFVPTEAPAAQSLAYAGKGGQIYGGDKGPQVTSPGGAFPGPSGSPNTGAGGNGAISNEVAAAQPGGAGGSGFVYVTEFSFVLTSTAAVAAARSTQPFGVSR